MINCDNSQVNISIKHNAYIRVFSIVLSLIVRGKARIRYKTVSTECIDIGVPGINNEYNGVEIRYCIPRGCGGNFWFGDNSPLIGILEGIVDNVVLYWEQGWACILWPINVIFVK